MVNSTKMVKPMTAIAHRFYLHGYHGRVLPRLVRRIIARTLFHRGWLAGHLGVFEQQGVRHGVCDRDNLQYRNQ
jgi:hypothetical protein